MVMRLPSISYGALYQTGLLDRMLDLVKANNMDAAQQMVNDATSLADSLQCPWCNRPGLHEDCWTPHGSSSA